MEGLRTAKIAVKAFDPSRAISIENLVLFHTECAIIAEFGYRALDLEVPEWLTDKMAGAKRQVEHLQIVAKEKELKTLEARMETLKTQAEKREEAEKRITELRKELGK